MNTDGRGRFTAEDSEHCQECNQPVGVWWHVPDELWARVTDYTDGRGIMCIGCFDVLAAAEGITLSWEAKEIG